MADAKLTGAAARILVTGAAGFVGFAVGTPLTAGVTAWVSVPILLLCMAFGVLILSGRTVREVVDAAVALLDDPDIAEDSIHGWPSSSCRSLWVAGRICTGLHFSSVRESYGFGRVSTTM